PHAPPPALHSFPTRRSSDLVAAAASASLAPAPPPPEQQREKRECREPGEEPVPPGTSGHQYVARRLGNAERAVRREHAAHVHGRSKSTRLNSSHVKISYAVF